MDIQEFNRRILQKQEQLKDLVRRKMPVIVGNIAKRHIEDDFRKGGFTHNGFHKWQETERQKNGGKGTDSRYGSLLSGRNHLSGSIEYAPECLMPVYTIRVVWYKLPSLQKCDALPGLCITKPPVSNGK